MIRKYYKILNLIIVDTVFIPFSDMQQEPQGIVLQLVSK